MGLNIEDAFRLVGQIYDASLDADQWPDLLCNLADACGMENAALVVVDPESSYSSVLSPRSDPEIAEAYNAYWWQHDPTTDTATKFPVGRMTTLADTGKQKFLASKFHNEFWRHSGLGAERLATSLFAKGDAFSSLVLQPSAKRDAISTEAYQTAALLIPHAARAVAISRKLHQLELQQAAIDHPFQPDQAGLILVDQKGYCLHADHAAESLICCGAVLKLENGVVRLRDDKANGLCKAALKSLAKGSLCLTGGAPVQLKYSPDQPPLELEILPCRLESHNPVGRQAVAKLVFHRRELSGPARVQNLQQQFGLTPAEAALTIEMLKGDGRSAAAERCGISVNTARTHLTRVFEKIGVTRQAELIRVVMDCER